MIVENKQTTVSFKREVFWLSNGNDSLFTWLYLPTTAPQRDIGFVLCPPLGHEYVHTHRTYRKVAESLASSGIPVIRFDLHGAGNSNGDALNPERLKVWQENISEQLQFLRSRTGVKKIGLFGIRLGATFALQAARNQKIDQLILWRPILKGRQFVRELTALSKFSSDQNSQEQSFIEAGGFVIAQQTIKDLESIGFSEEETIDVKAILEVADVGQSSDKLRKIFTSSSHIDVYETASYEAMMAEPQVANTPDDVINYLSKWVEKNSIIQKSKSEVLNQPNLSVSNILSTPEFKETALLIEDKLFAVLGEPSAEKANKSIIIFCNSGAVHTVGPNRLYVELTRNLIKQGYTTLRLDLHNIGDSVLGSVDKEGFPYPDDEKAFADVSIAIDFAKKSFPDYKVIVGGVCSGAYWAFKAATLSQAGRIDKLLVINPLTFDWTSESVLEDRKDQGAVRDKIHYMNAAKNKEKWIKLLKGQVDFKKIFFTALNMIEMKLSGAVTRVLEKLNLLPTKKLAFELLAIQAKGIETHFIFSSLDPGYDLLMNSGGSKVKQMSAKKQIAIKFIDGADHTFSKQTHRRELLEKILQQSL